MSSYWYCYIKFLPNGHPFYVGKGSVYNYIKNDGFPENTGRGIPRSWRKHEVLMWCAKYGKGELRTPK